MAEGRFIVLEGLDGAGITTQTEFLRTWCQRNGIAVSVTKEPSDGPAGGVIKWILRRELTGLPGESLALLFAADRHYHIDREIAPALDDGMVVICDRYYLSSFAYQLVEVEDLEWLRGLNSKCPAPNLTIFLDVPADVCLQRMTSDVWRGLDKLQLYEELSRLEQVRKNFLYVISLLQREGQRIVVIDATRKMDLVAQDIISEARGIVGKTRPSRRRPRDAGSEQIAAILEAQPVTR